MSHRQIDRILHSIRRVANLLFRRKVGFLQFLAVLIAGFVAQGVSRPARLVAQPLLPDMVPFVREDVSYLANWDILDGRLRLQTMFANIGDGLFQIRADGSGGESTIPVVQRVFEGVDNGAIYEDYVVGTTVNFHQQHGHIHLDDFSEFQLLEVVVDQDGRLQVGNLAASEVKSSFRLHDSARVPMPEFAAALSFESGNTGLFQNVSRGWGDVYSHGTDGQSIDLDGVAMGRKYWLRQIVDPLNLFVEKDETNNVATILINIDRPGDAVRFPWNEYVRPGDQAPPTVGDLTLDGAVDADDWATFKAGFQIPLGELDARSAYLLGDFDLDGKHTLYDAVAFREAYEAVHGSGSWFALTALPEPVSWTLACLVAAARVSVRRKRRGELRRPFPSRVVVAACVVARLLSWEVAPATAHVTLWTEDFESVVLGPNVHESLARQLAWTDVGPAGWTVDDSGVPSVGDDAMGVAEWEGWSFADRQWWSEAAGNQLRADFTRGIGVVAIADPDEWDDRGAPASNLGFYNAWMRSPLINLTGAAGEPATLQFDSSWRHECCDERPTNANNQTAVVRASFDGGASFTEIMRWESHPLSPNFKVDAVNESVVVPLGNPPDAEEVVLEFGLIDAGNDWWWAVDNLRVEIPADPSILEVNTTTGQVKIKGGDVIPVPINSVSITSAGGGLRPASYNGLSVRKPDSVDGPDADATVGNSDGEQWELLTANTGQIFDGFLFGSSTFDDSRAENLGAIYDRTKNTQDLVFTYSTIYGTEITGIIEYVQGGSLLGDYNGNGSVDAADYTIWKDSFGQSGQDLAADGNGNGVIDAADYTIWKD
ncbi:MAG: hypothetical protein KDA61_15120, partial [Planctomycetales bacterium]|nr:hypothetical protein [Planctomycetales bacterium]